MSISSISSNTPLQAPQRTPAVEAGEAVRGGKDVRNDSDSDDATQAAAKASAPKSTTNTLGQEIGKNLNVSA